jgi:hypothetical protein
MKLNDHQFDIVHYALGDIYLEDTQKQSHCDIMNDFIAAFF